MDGGCEMGVGCKRNFGTCHRICGDNLQEVCGWWMVDVKWVSVVSANLVPVTGFAVIIRRRCAVGGWWM